MRLKADMPEARYATIYLDGQKLDRCFEADDEAGYAIVARTNWAGKTIPADQYTDWTPDELEVQGVVAERRTGQVRIELSQSVRSGGPVKPDLYHTGDSLLTFRIEPFRLREITEEAAKAIAELMVERSKQRMRDAFLGRFPRDEVSDV